MEIQNNCVIIDGVTIKFPSNIEEHICWKHIGVVLLDRVSEKDYRHNVYGIAEGKVIWRIQEILDYYPDGFNNRWLRVEGFAHIEVYAKNPNLLLATTTTGWRYAICPENGRIVEKIDWVK